MNFDPNTLAMWVGGRWEGQPRGVVKGFSIDSRTIRKGEMFVALSTDSRDGHDFLNDAAKRGAVAALVSHKTDSKLPQLIVEDVLKAFHRLAAVWRQNYKGKVIGITGSCGKTSTKDLLALLLGKRKTHATERNFNNHLGVPLTITGIDYDKHDYAVIEAGISEIGEMDMLSRMIAPDIAIVTMVGNAHLEGLGSIEQVADEKSKIGLHLKVGGQIIYPASCCEYENFRRYPGRSLIICSEEDEEHCDNPQEVVPYEVSKRRGGLSIAIWRRSTRADRFDIPKWGPGMVSNAVMCIMASQILGVTQSEIQKRIKRWKPTAMRGESIRQGGRTLYLDCYNANPDSFADSFYQFASKEVSKPRMYVLGCMGELGEESERLHYLTGSIMPVRAEDRVVVVGEYAEAFCKGIVEAGACPDKVKVCTELGPLRGEIASFRGNVFLKGSREYALETLIPGEVEGRAVAC